MDKESELKSLENTIFGCTRCTRLRQVTPIPYPHIVYRPLQEIEYMIVARNPGLEHNYSEISKTEFMEVYQQRFWDCRIGQYLRQVIGAEAFVKVFFCNICKCSSPGNSFLTVEEIQNCKEYLEKQIELVKPKKIVTFGTEALHWFCLDLNLWSVFGKSYHRVKPFKHVVIPLYHPSYFMYKPNKEKENKQERILRYNLA